MVSSVLNEGDEKERKKKQEKKNSVVCHRIDIWRRTKHNVKITLVICWYVCENVLWWLLQTKLQMALTAVVDSIWTNNKRKKKIHLRLRKQI